MKITKKTTMAKILAENPKAAKLLMESGMHCIGCPMAMQESLEQGCLAHGMEDKDIDEIVDKLNNKKKK